jgi:hypothetical protein
LLIALHDLRWSDVGRIRIATRSTQRASLSQQVPRLVERGLELFQPTPVVIGRIPGRLSLPERVLLGNECSMVPWIC